MPPIFLFHLESPFPTHDGQTLRGRSWGRYGFVAALIFVSSFIASPLYAQAIVKDCSSFRENPASFAKSVHKLVDEVLRLSQRDAALRRSIEAGGRLTERIYAAGLIERVPDCNHEAGKPNLEVLGGAFPVSGTPQSAGLDGKGNGVTVIIRGQPYTHCKAFQAAAVTGGEKRSTIVRFEPPGSKPDAFGKCRVGNLIGSIMSGRNLPQPNTVYIFEETAAVEDPPEADGLPMLDVTIEPFMWKTTLQTPIGHYGGLSWDLGTGRVSFPDIKVCAVVKGEEECAPICTESSRCTASVPRSPEGLKLKVYDVDAVVDDVLFEHDYSDREICDPCGITGGHVVLFGERSPETDRLLRLGRKFAQENRARLISSSSQSGQNNIVEKTSFGVDMLKNLHNVVLKNGSKLESSLVYQVDSVTHNGETLRDRHAGFQTNCHGTTFLGGELWLQDAGTVFNEALEQIGYGEVNVGDFVLWADQANYVVHSATIVAKGASAGQVKLYQDAGGLREHIVSLGDHDRGDGPGTDPSFKRVFARFRAGW